MKKLLILTIILFLITGCSSNNTDNNQNDNQEIDNNETIDNIETDTNNEIKSLVIYFSRTGEQYGVGVIDEGNTAIVAKMIAEELNADTFEVLPIEDYYPYTYNELTDVAKKEQAENARPEYQGNLPDLSEYDLLFIGAPVWWSDWPMIMYTLFESNDFSNKDIYVFNTHAGSGLSGFTNKLQSACPNSNVIDGLAISGTDAQNNKDKVRNSIQDWLKDIIK